MEQLFAFVQGIALPLKPRHCAVHDQAIRRTVLSAPRCHAANSEGNNESTKKSPAKHPTTFPSGDQTRRLVLRRIAEVRRLLRSEAISEKAIAGLERMQDKLTYSVIKALGLEPLEDDTPGSPPTYPPFEPILALQLAGYSFRAYLEPPQNSYCEVCRAPVQGTLQKPDAPKQYVTTYEHYPYYPIVSSSATGVFVLSYIFPDELLEKRPFLIASVNSTVMLDLLKNRSASVLRLRSFPNHAIVQDDVLRVDLFNSEEAFICGEASTFQALLPLEDLVQRGFDTQSNQNLEKCSLILEPIPDKEQQTDFFQAASLPVQFRLPFGTFSESSGNGDVQNFSGVVMRMNVTFVPLNKSDVGLIEETGTSPATVSRSDESLSDLNTALAAIKDSVLDVDTTDDDPDQTLTFFGQSLPRVPIFRSNNKVTQTRLPTPEDWVRLSTACRTVAANVGPGMLIRPLIHVSANATPCLFIENLSTDTEVWLFRDDVNKSIVTAFRGTEQVKWRDFVTDAQLFLQRWAPGEEIDLSVDVDKTVGLGSVLPTPLASSLRASTPQANEAGVESRIPLEAPAVHFGFLQAFMSVRDAMYRGLDLLSSDFAEEYSFLFTGHSLGGALATLATADFQHRFRLGPDKLACVTFGAPRVGNVNFSRIYNSLVSNSFRIINDTDLIARMPRSPIGRDILNRYKHCGRAVLINDNGEHWIEGEQDRSLLKHRTDPIGDRHQDLQDFLDFESNMWSELFSGRSVKHHLEDSYFTAMRRCIERIAGENFEDS